MLVRWSYRFLDAVVGSESFATIAVSSAKVLKNIFARHTVHNTNKLQWQCMYDMESFKSWL